MLSTVSAPDLAVTLAMAAELCLRIEVDTVRRATDARQSGSEIDGGSRLADTAFLIENSNDAHTAWILAEIGVVDECITC